MKQNAESYGETGDRMQDFLHYTAESGISDCGFGIADLAASPSGSLRGAWSIMVNLMRSTMMRSTTSLPPVIPA
jgi:hypothetical protein